MFRDLTHELRTLGFDDCPNGETDPEHGVRCPFVGAVVHGVDGAVVDRSTATCWCLLDVLREDVVMAEATDARRATGARRVTQTCPTVVHGIAVTEQDDG